MKSILSNPSFNILATVPSLADVLVAILGLWIPRQSVSSLCLYFLIHGCIFNSGPLMLRTSSPLWLFSMYYKIMYFMLNLILFSLQCFVFLLVMYLYWIPIILWTLSPLPLEGCCGNWLPLAFSILPAVGWFPGNQVIPLLLKDASLVACTRLNGDLRVPPPCAGSRVALSHSRSVWVLPNGLKMHAHTAYVTLRPVAVRPVHRRARSPPACALRDPWPRDVIGRRSQRWSTSRG